MFFRSKYLKIEQMFLNRIAFVHQLIFSPYKEMVIMPKTKEEMITREINGYHPSIFFNGYEKYRRQFWLGMKRRKVKDEKNWNNRNKTKRQSRSV